MEGWMNQAKRGNDGGNLNELPWLQPRNDAVFKYLFGQHVDILQSFLENVLNLSSEEY